MHIIISLIFFTRWNVPLTITCTGFWHSTNAKFMSKILVGENLHNSKTWQFLRFLLKVVEEPKNCESLLFFLRTFPIYNYKCSKIDFLSTLKKYRSTFCVKQYMLEYVKQSCFSDSQSNMYFNLATNYMNENQLISFEVEYEDISLTCLKE